MGRPNIDNRGFTLVEVMMVTAISAFVFAGVLSAYIFLGRALARQVNEADLESRGRTALKAFTDDITAAVTFEPLGGLALTAAAPSSTQFTIDTVITLAAGGSVTGTATYTYTPPLGTTPGTLTVVRVPPSGILSSALITPSWATNEYGATNNPRTLLKNVVNLSFVYHSSASTYITSTTTFPYVASPNTYTYVVSGSGISVPIPASNVIGIKLVSMNFTLAEPFTGGAAYSTLTLSSGPVLMKNNFILQ